MTDMLQCSDKFVTISSLFSCVIFYMNPYIFIYFMCRILVGGGGGSVTHSR
jgi:hypothetical protein